MFKHYMGSGLVVGLCEQGLALAVFRLSGFVLVDFGLSGPVLAAFGLSALRSAVLHGLVSPCADLVFTTVRIELLHGRVSPV